MTRAAPRFFRISRLIVAGSAFFLGAVSVFAIGDQPRIGYVFPAGSAKGSVQSVIVGGQFLKDAKSVHVSGKGVTAVIVRYKMSPVQELELASSRYYFEREKFDAAVPDKNGVLVIKDTAKGRVWTRFELQKLSARMKALERIVFDPKRQPNAQIGETLALEITVAQDAEPGDHEIRVLTSDGLSNPLIFQVGEFPEVRDDWRFLPNACPVLPAVLNGQILPGDQDRFIFTAQKGKRIVFDVRARSLNPYLADAVPGWIQAVAAVYDMNGAELAYEDDFGIDPDPVLCFEAPSNGSYVFEIRDAIYRGREDFVYRVVAGELAFVTNIFPLGGEAGAKNAIRVSGYNLPWDRIEFTTPKSTGAMDLSKLDEYRSLTRPLIYETENMAQRLESQGTEQPIVLPVALDGVISARDEVDVYPIRLKAGQTVTAEVRARRLGSRLDPILRIRDASGTELAVNDDTPDPMAGLTTHQADSFLKFSAPSNGIYDIEIADVQESGGPNHSYRLLIREPVQDFQILCMPSAINIPQGGSAVLSVLVKRMGGFIGEVRIRPEGLTNSFRIQPAIFPAGSDRADFTLSALPGTAPGVYPVSFSGYAQIGGEQVVRKAVPAEDMMQAFLWRHLVPRAESLVAVAAPYGLDMRSTLAEGTTLKIPAGGEFRLQLFEMKTGYFPAEATLVLLNPVKGLELKSCEITPDKRGVTLVLGTDAAKIAPGTRGNLVFQVQSGYNDKKPFGVSPAIPFEIIKATE
jgi:hypothetical protein